ncbi:MAG: iron-containing alcohol dehydrogenase [Gammaproteobacteria bacterium]|nr:iron-containing alcohol dehydrogenase [Gammaproteobacteria bacterium]
MTLYTHYRQERVYFDEAFDQALCKEAERLDSRRVFLLASTSLAHDTDFIERLKRALGNRFAGFVTGMPAHTPREAVLEMSRAARDARADLIVTLGGGSLTDGAKMVRLCLANAIDDLDGFERVRTVTEADGRSVQPEFNSPDIPQVTIPTTLSGGEFNITAGCTDSRLQAKQSYRHEQLIPTAVILDPAVTLNTPAWLWLSTGMRAVDHCVETICSKMANWQADGAALNGLRLLCEGLPRTRRDPSDLRARLQCQIGAWQAMEHNQSGVRMGASHGIGHVLGGTCNVPHGHTSCVMLPAALRWNLSVNAEQQARVSAAMGRPGEPAADVVEALVRELGQPTRLSEVGVDASQFERIAQHAMHDRYIHTNPRPITSPAQVLEILALAA